MRPRLPVLAIVAAVAASSLIQAPVTAQSPSHPDIGLFFEATSTEPEVADAAFEQIGANWRDGYAIILVDLATLLTPSDYGRRRRDAGRPIRPVDPSSLIRRRLIQFLAQQTGRDLPDDLNLWRDWIWDHDFEPHPDYALIKGAVYGLIDERMREFFRPNAPATIRLDEIVWGGVSVNGIPPLDHPAHVEASEAAYLKDDHIVFGMALRGEARAYPRRIIAWHELVRDAVGGVELTIVYCTLCGTVIPYGSEVGGRLVTLGTSGLLYRSNKLMFDNATKSLWSTLVGAPVVGPLVGRGFELEAYPVVTTTWGEWRTAHPNTKVLSIDTGFERDYSEGAAYRDYFGTDRLMFQVPELDDRLKNKAEILAIRLPDPSPETPPLAIAAAYLDQHPLYELEYGGGRLVIVTSPDGANRVFESADVDFDRLLDDGVIADTSGRRWRVSEAALVAEFDDALRLPRVAAHRAFWFGWYAQCPATELIK